ncbi:hypothetical protein GL218_09179 [Daldinia childiae]|uniref:uncharacterized protein n=1 Tax=Daldinia childiae TaxID=326645 RepID=UPI001445F90C|nr:uncharacterized protein GL218_09179 [Daldinia childiae]KAF3066359.1 hypothetical protein GL218_09179 [Daldinia childiae]
MISTLLPFLYNTRTILRTNPRISLTFSRSLHATRRQLREGDEIPFASYVPQDETPPEQPLRRGTITPSERRVFESIFADIKSRGLKPFVPEESSATSATRTTLSIMQQAVQDASHIRPVTLTTPGIPDDSTQDRHKALLRFPPELRAAASKAFDTIQPSNPRLPSGDDIAYDEASITATREDPDGDEGWKVPANTVDRTAELEAKRYPERTRVEGLITAAETDFKLWDVLEKEVFVMPARLGIQGDAETDVTSTENNTSSQELSLYIHGPLYPEYLLLALRRLDTAFRAPSPLAFSILPRIKELGLESYILGISTPFYNELLEIYWTRRGDLSGVLNLLEEMRHCGLRFDAQTASFLGRVNTALTLLATREASGSFARALMNMPEYDRSVRHRIKRWHEAVDLSINEEID